MHSDRSMRNLYKGNNNIRSLAHGDFIRFVEDIVGELVRKGECIVLRDFNIDLMIESCHARKL